MIKENFTKYIENAILENWNQPAFTNYESISVNYGEVASKIKELHSIFTETGLKKGDKVALIGGNSINWAITYLSTVTYGAVLVPLLADFQAKDIAHLVNHSESTLFFSEEKLAKGINFSEISSLNIVFSLTDFSIIYSKKEKTITKIDKRITKIAENNLTPENFDLEEIPNSELLEILYTSGTSGFSKGVMLNHNSLAANVRYARKNMPLVSGDSILSFLPLAHAYGCAFEFLYPFSIGCHITFLGKLPSPPVLIKAFAKVQPRLILSVPLIIEKIYKKKIKPEIDKPLIKTLLKIPILRNKIYAKINASMTESFGGKFKEVVIGGAALNPEVEHFLKKINFKFSTGYGMTECGPLISYDGWRTRKIRSTGKVVDTLEVKIDRETPESESGEICMRGENVMLGYYKNEVATKEALDAEGWLHSGDLGSIDENGYIEIKGRSKSMILGPSGQNIYPEEIEAQINHLKLVGESLVIECDGKLCALVYPDFENEEVKRLSKEVIKTQVEAEIKHINKELPAFMRVAKIEIQDKEFEKTPKKSIKRFLYTSANFQIHKVG